jgi:hypothetical protein
MLHRYSGTWWVGENQRSCADHRRCRVEAFAEVLMAYRADGSHLGAQAAHDLEHVGQSTPAAASARVEAHEAPLGLWRQSALTDDLADRVQGD